MIEKMHDYFMKELAQNKQVDTVFVLLAIVFNLMMLAINSAAQSSKDYSLIIVLFAVGAIVTLITAFVLLKGKDTREKLVKGLLAMYEDSGVGKYFDKAIMKNDESRSRLQIAAVVVTFLASVIIPILLKLIYKESI